MTADPGTPTLPAPPVAARLETLEPSACLSRLGQATFGRLALAGDGRPAIIPVRLRAGTAGIRLAADPLAGVVPDHGETVALEAECLDPGAVWSVIVHGTVQPLAGSGVTALSWFELFPTSITGRRLTQGAAPPHAHPAPPLVLPGVGPLRRDDAFRLLAQAEVGCMAVAPGGNPRIFPVNYRLDGESVIFRTGTGTKLHAIARSLVAFETDWFDADGRGWSVMIGGWGQEITGSEPATLQERIRSLSLQPWLGGDRPYFVRIIPVSVAAYSYRWEH